MKKIFILILAAAAVAVSCQKHQVDSPITPVAGPTVDISVVSSSVDDSTFTVVFTPKVENDDISYYSFLVYESEVPEELDSTTLYQCGYDGVAYGTIKYAEGSKTYELKLTAADGINPNTVYQIAAVAGSKMGIPGAITTDDVLTSDSFKPQPTGTPTSDTKLGCITIKFNKDIHLATEDGAKAYATYKRVWDPHEEESDSLFMEVDSIIVEGNEMTLFAPVKISGAYVFFTWDKGLVKSDVDSSCAEYKTVIFDAKDGNATKAIGCYFRFPTTSFGWTRLDHNFNEVPEDSIISFVSTDDYYLLQSDSAMYNLQNPLEDISVTYKNSKKSTEYSSCKYGWFSGNNYLLPILFNVDEDPEMGDYVNYSIKEDTFEDIWGNYNEAYENEDNFLLGYGYTVDDFCGKFCITQIYWIDNENFDSCNDTMTITKAGDDSVKISGLGIGYFKATGQNFTPTNSILCAIDRNQGILFLPFEQGIGTSNGKLVLMGWIPPSSTTFYSSYLNMKSVGQYTIDNSWFDYAFLDGSGLSYNNDWAQVIGITKITSGVNVSSSVEIIIPANRHKKESATIKLQMN